MMDLEYDRGWRLDLDANPIGLSAVQFRVWAPRAKTVSVHVCDPRRNPVPMEPREFGYFEVTIESVRPGDRYHYLVDGEKVRPDTLGYATGAGWKVESPVGLVCTRFRGKRSGACCTRACHSARGHCHAHPGVHGRVISGYGVISR